MIEASHRTIGIAEVVGSNPTTRSTFINLVNYGINVRSILAIVGQNVS